MNPGNLDSHTDQEFSEVENTMLQAIDKGDLIEFIENLRSFFQQDGIPERIEAADYIYCNHYRIVGFLGRIHDDMAVYAQVIFRSTETATTVDALDGVRYAVHEARVDKLTTTDLGYIKPLHKDFLKTYGMQHPLLPEVISISSNRISMSGSTRELSPFAH